MDTGPHPSLHNSTLLMRYVLSQNTHITTLSRTVCPGMVKIQDYSHVLEKEENIWETEENILYCQQY